MIGTHIQKNQKNTTLKFLTKIFSVHDISKIYQIKN
jgi:hypothetical protein